MKPVPMKPRVHVLVCVNERAANDPLPSCTATGEAVFERLRQWVNGQGLAGAVWVNRAGCLGWCHAAGATVAIYPQGALLHRVTVEDCAAIVRDHIIPGLQA